MARIESQGAKFAARPSKGFAAVTPPSHALQSDTGSSRDHGTLAYITTRKQDMTLARWTTEAILFAHDMASRAAIGPFVVGTVGRWPALAGQAIGGRQGSAVGGDQQEPRAKCRPNHVAANLTMVRQVSPSDLICA
jgi:hypothetical protein